MFLPCSSKFSIFTVLNFDKSSVFLILSQYFHIVQIFSSFTSLLSVFKIKLTQNSQQSAKEMFEVPFKYPVNEAVAVLTARVSVSVTDGLWHFVENFAQQFAYNCLQLFIVKTRLCLFYLQGSDLHYGISGSTFALSNHLYTHLPMLC